MCLGIPGRICTIRDDAGLRMGVVDFGGVRREVCLAYLGDDVAVGEYAIVHVGFAISKVDEVEARKTYDALRAMSQLDELEWMADIDGRESATAEPPPAGLPPSPLAPPPSTRSPIP